MTSSRALTRVTTRRLHHATGGGLITRTVLPGATGPAPAPFTLEPEEARSSLSRLDDLEATWVLPGHGPAWNGGVPEALRLIRAA